MIDVFEHPELGFTDELEAEEAARKMGYTQPGVKRSHFNYFVERFLLYRLQRRQSEA